MNTNRGGSTIEFEGRRPGAAKERTVSALRALATNGDPQPWAPAYGKGCAAPSGAYHFLPLTNFFSTPLKSWAISFPDFTLQAFHWEGEERIDVIPTADFYMFDRNSWRVPPRVFLSYAPRASASRSISSRVRLSVTAISRQLRKDSGTKENRSNDGPISNPASAARWT